MPLPTQLLNRYRVVGRIAVGALGTVLAAVDERTGQEVALKLFDGSDNNFAAWVDELRLATRLDHPNIVSCLDVGEDKQLGVHLLVFERAQGGSLRRAMVVDTFFKESAVAELLHDVGSALVYAHAHQVIHRDVKPENILALQRTGQSPWVLTDFGTGRFLARGTFADSFVGSLLYMAPEVYLGATNHASDQYSLGMVGVELLTGEQPTTRVRDDFLYAHRHYNGVRGIVARMITPDPQRRFVDMSAVVHTIPNHKLPPQTRLDDGRRLTIERGKLRFVSPGGNNQTVRGLIGRNPKFVNLDGECAPLIVGGNRLLTCSASRITALWSTDHPVDVVAASSEHGVVWWYQNGVLCCQGLASTSAPARAKLPPEYRRMLENRRGITGAIVSPTTAVFAWQGSPELLYCHTRQQKLTGRLQILPWPIERFERVGQSAVGLMGNQHLSMLVELTAERVVTLERIELGVHLVRIAASGAPRLEKLVALPGSIRSPNTEEHR